MSIISSYEFDNSPALAKRFSSLARSYFDNPPVKQDSSVNIPLENLFRMLEMFRYNSFEDESRRGVLALQKIEKFPEKLLKGTTWHDQIENALKQAVNAAYGNNVNKDEAINEIEGSLRWLATGKDSPGENELNRTRKFFDVFEANIKSS